MRWVVYYTSFGDTCSVAVYASSASSAVAVAEGFIRASGQDEVLAWGRQEWEVMEDGVLLRGIWDNTRGCQGHVNLLRGF